MRKLLVLVMFLVGCVTTHTFDYSSIKDDVFLDPVNSWENTQNGPWKTITLRAINRKYRSVEIDVVCVYKSDNTVFGVRTVSIGLRNDKIFVVRGFSRANKETVECGVKAIR